MSAGLRPVILGGGLIVLAHLWLVGVALYAGAYDPGIGVRTVEIPYYVLLLAGICLPLFQWKLRLYRWIVKALGNEP
jgi:hypothetical protein